MTEEQVVPVGKAAFNLADIVKIRRNDLKDPKQRDKMDKIVKFALQNMALHNDYADSLKSGQKSIHDLLKDEEFKLGLVMIIEAQLCAVGFNSYVCIAGKDLQVELKISKKSLMAFLLGSHLQLIFYEVPYINLPAMGVNLPIQEFKQWQKSLPEQQSSKQKKIADKDSVVIAKEWTFFSDEEYREYHNMVKECLTDTCKWYIDQTRKTQKSELTKRLEALLLSLLYNRGKFEDSKDYNWHIAMSEVHDFREAKFHKIYTSHYLLTKNKANSCQDRDVNQYKGTLNELRPLRFHIDLEVELTIGDKKKLLNVVVWNQRWEAISTIQSVFQGGWQALKFDWKGTLMSLNGLHAMLFMTMIASLFIGNKYCTQINAERTDMLMEMDRDYRTAVANGERAEEDYPAEPKMTDMEWICNIQQQFLGQIAIAVLVLTVLRQLIPRAQAAGRKNALLKAQAKLASDQQKAQANDKHAKKTN